MSATEPLFKMIGINSSKLSKAEKCILEIELFMRICTELNNINKSINNTYFILMKIDAEGEKAMLDEILISSLIKDILVTGDYSIQGIASYTDTPEEVVCDVVIGRNTAPSLSLSWKILNLHMSVRPHLYREVMKKITAECLIQE
jgi:hypothetical protein